MARRSETKLGRSRDAFRKRNLELLERNAELETLNIELQERLDGLSSLETDLALAHRARNQAERSGAVAKAQVERAERELEIERRVTKRLIDRLARMLIESVPTIGK